MKLNSLLILKIVIYFLGLLVFAICTFGLPLLIMSEIADGADFDYGPIFLGLYITAIPFFYALYHALNLLSYIGRNNAFSDESVQSFRHIRNSAYVICALFALGMPYVFYVADRDDAPGVVAMGIVIIGASYVIGTFSALMRKLVQNAVDIKSENDLTV